MFEIIFKCVDPHNLSERKFRTSQSVLFTIMFDFSRISETYLSDLVSFLHSIKWMFCTLNTQYIKEEILDDNKEFIVALSPLDLNNFPELEAPEKNHPECLQKFITQVNRFKISFDMVVSDSLKSEPIKRMSIKKQYEIENVSKVIHSVCKDDVAQLVDFGSGLGYLGQYLFDKYNYNILGLEGCDDRVEKAKERQLKFHPKSIGKVKHVQHFISRDSGDFILKQFPDNTEPLAIFGLHGCGDLTVNAIKLFLSIERVKKLIFMPCCYHKMSSYDPQGDEFNFFPLSEELKSIVKNHSTFLNRPFLRLAGQQSPAKWKEMSEAVHWIHGKNMFERALVEAVVMEDETIKRISNIIVPENRVTIDDVMLKYELIEKSSGKSKEWTEHHHQKFHDLRHKYDKGEELSENLFCLQTTIQCNCENLVLIDRIRYIEEEAARANLQPKVSVKKLQNDKLSPRCFILIAEKL